MSTNDDKLARAIDALPEELDAPRDLWAGPGGIGARLAQIEVKRRRAVNVRRAAAGASLLLAAAGVALVVRWQSIQPQAGIVTPHGVRDVATARAPSAPSAPEKDVDLVPEEASYLAAATALEATLNARRAELPEKDAAAVAASLRALDTAIATTRASLADHPEDVDLRAELDSEYEQKIDAMNDVLQWTTRS